MKASAASIESLVKKSDSFDSSSLNAEIINKINSQNKDIKFAINKITEQNKLLQKELERVSEENLSNAAKGELKEA